MTPEVIDALQKREQSLTESLVNISCGCTVTYTRLAELARAEKDGRLVILPDAKYTDADGEEALRKAMWTCGNTNNPVTRYAADAIAEKLCRKAKDENPPLTLEELREMGGEPYWHVGLQEDSAPPHWSILDPFFAKHIENYCYGERWLAYRRRPENQKDFGGET